MNAAGRWLRRGAWALLVAVLAAATLTARVVHDGEREMTRSDAAFDRGDVRAAASHARRAAVLYAPGAPHVGPAYRRLIAIATGAEAAGDPALAQIAWGAVRGAALETRHVWVPRRAELERANANLARLSTVVAEVPADQARAVQHARRQLAQDDAPRALWIALLVLGFLAAAAGLVLTGVKGVTPAGRLTLGQAKLGLLLLVIGAACWTIAALRA